MVEDINLNIVVSNILCEKRYSHCRLCLKVIKEHFVRFNDAVSIHPSSGIFQPLSEILSNLLGESVCDEITAVEAVCSDCVSEALASARFIERCQSSSNILNQMFANLCNTFSAVIDTSNTNKTLYITIEDLQSQILLVNNPKKKKSYVTSQRLFQCKACNVYLDTFADVKAHNSAIHGTLTCDKCIETFASDIDLVNHEGLKHKFKCPDCPQYKRTEQGLRDHHNRLHYIHLCKECGKSFKGLDKLHIHEEKHKAKSSCPKCGKTYTTKEFYEKHVQLCIKNLIEPHPRRSSMEKSYSCEKCGKGYSTSGGLRVHDRFAHGNAKPHECKECGKQFTAPSYLKIHMIKHTGEKNFKCNLCTSRFVSKEALLYHTRRHTGEKPYSCKLCNERFVNSSARAEHIKFKHIGPTLMCEICSRKFVTMHFLKQHIRRHHDPTSKLHYGRNIIPPNLPLEENMRRHHDPTSKLYYGRNMIPHNLPIEENMKRFIIKNEINS